jgi:hypothetical protein
MVSILQSIRDFAFFDFFETDKCELVSIHTELLEMDYGASNYFGSLSSLIGMLNQTLVMKIFD